MSSNPTIQQTVRTIQALSSNYTAPTFQKVQKGLNTQNQQNESNSSQNQNQIVTNSQNESNSTLTKKKKKDVLLKHLSVPEKQKLAHLILTIHQLTEQKLFYETKYASLLPKLKQMMEKFEERSRRLSQYQNAMKKLKIELDEWKDKSEKLIDQVQVVENERETWRIRFEEAEMKLKHYENLKRYSESRSVQVDASRMESSVQTDEYFFQQQQQQQSQYQRAVGYSSPIRQAPNRIYNQESIYQPNNYSIQQQISQPFYEKILIQSQHPYTENEIRNESYRSPTRMVEENTGRPLHQKVYVSKNTDVLYSDTYKRYDNDISRTEPKRDNLSDIFDSDSESIYSVRQREVDALLQKSEAVLNRSRASRPSTPEELLETRKKRHELLIKSSNLHKASNMNQEASTLIINNSQHQISQSNNSTLITNQKPNLQRIQNVNKHQPTKQDRMESQRQDANDLFHFVDILEHNLDNTIDHRNNNTELENINNPLIESHVSFNQDDDNNSSFSTSTSHSHPAINSSEAWFDTNDTFQENDIFDIIS